jgi:hypothetical protein
MESDQRQFYLLAVQGELRLAHRDFDQVLDEAIIRLSALRQAHD